MDEIARETLILAHIALAYKLARRFALEDGAQIACEALTRAADAWDTRSPFDRFASTVITNALIDTSRAAWRRREVCDSAVALALVPSFEDDLIAAEMAVLQRALLAEIRATLPPALALALDAKASGDFARFARRHGIPERTLRYRWHRAAGIARARLAAAA